MKSNYSAGWYIKQGLKALCALVGLGLVACGCQMFYTKHPVAAVITLILGLGVGAIGALAIRSIVKARKEPPVEERKYRIVEATPEPASSAVRSTPSFSVTYQGGGGSKDYEYTSVGIYRPKGVADMPPIGADIEFEEDPENPYDILAIKAVYEGETIGYLNKGKIRNMIRDWLQRGDYYSATISRADDRLEFDIELSRE